MYAESRNGGGYLFLTIMIFRTLYSMQGLKALSVLVTKVNPALKGDDDCRIVWLTDLALHSLLALL